MGEKTGIVRKKGNIVQSLDVFIDVDQNIHKGAGIHTVGSRTESQIQKGGVRS